LIAGKARRAFGTLPRAPRHASCARCACRACGLTTAAVSTWSWLPGRAGRNGWALPR